jgi:hypothetical protein
MAVSHERPVSTTSAPGLERLREGLGAHLPDDAHAVHHRVLGELGDVGHWRDALPRTASRTRVLSISEWMVASLK